MSATPKEAIRSLEIPIVKGLASINLIVVETKEKMASERTICKMREADMRVKGLSSKKLARDHQ